jgi:glycosyltransferase involved in cell wall biosynthesis
MRIAIVGTRGIPAAYGGFETMAQELSERLAERGHLVTVYSRGRRTGAGLLPRGVESVVLPCIHTKYLETVTHTAVSVVHALGRRYDAILMCNAANAAMAWIPRLGGTPVALNVDGLERKRDKWNALGRAWYALGERLAVVTPNRLVTDARVIRAYYRERYGAESTYIPYGTAEVGQPVPPPAVGGPLARFGVMPGEYILYVSRLEPENHAHTVVSAFAVCHDIPAQLVVTGDAPYAGEYIKTIRTQADVRTVFTGGVYGPGYHELQAHAAIYIQATTVGGVHPALIEAMGHGRSIICADTPEQRETLGDAGLYFAPGDAASLARAMRTLWHDPERRRELGERARRRAVQEYSWDHVTSAYERLFEEMSAALAGNEPCEWRFHKRRRAAA